MRRNLWRHLLCRLAAHARDWCAYGSLGAKRADVLRLVLTEAMKLIVIGIVLGVGAALALTKAMASLLYGVSTSDPLIFLSVTLLLVIVSLAACYVPARRAMRVDPMVALRYE